MTGQTTLPRYLGVTEKGTKHIVIGIEPETLCRNSITAAGYTDPIPYTNDVLDFDVDCDDCRHIWMLIREDINPEPTTRCDECDAVVTEPSVRLVDAHKSNQTLYICKKCYVKIRDSEKTSVTTPYKNARRSRSVPDKKRALDFDMVKQKDSSGVL